ncbi:hypothetical protein ACJMK2_002522 [Sinanodonta woodiana]|uniref:Uncharacterized protein n=1 Tax=Sinanodonta woodiana TaxID=1069815 RepID=A0ABD3XX67_SINWO
MASDTTSGNMSAGIMSKQDLDDYLKEFDDAYETVITTIPRDGSLTIDEFIKQHEVLANEFSDRLIEVANKASKLKALVSFVNTTADDGRTSETGYDEYKSETEEENDIKHFPVKKKANILLSCTSSDIDENDENNACVEDEDALSKLLILKNDIKWLTVPFLAVERDNIEVVEMCYKTGIDLEIFRNLKGQTLLNHYIVQSKLNFDIVNVLLKCIGVNIGAKHGKTPVMTCIQNSKITVKERFALLKRLIDAGADVMNRSFYPGTILHDFINSLAMEMNVEKLNEWKSVIDLLLRKGVDINATDFVGQTALVCAITTVPPTGLEDSDAYDLEAKRNLVSARRCKIEIVEYLMHKGANMEVIGNNGYTALCMTLANQNVDVVETLVKHGANVNHLTNIKMSPAHVLCCEGDWSEGNDIETILLPSLRILLNAGLNLNIKGLDDSTVLHFASAKMNHTICEFLVKSGADLGATDYLRRTPLHMAVRNIDIMVLKTLINLGADIEAKDIHGDSPLTHACLHDNTNAVRILVENGADCKACGDLGIHPIHIAAEGGDCSMMAILENAGCDLSTRDASGSTPLHYAASDGNPDTVQYLLTHNVNKNYEDSQGLVPLDLALLRGEYRDSTFLADCPSEVKFGRLPPGIFPNRPFRQMHELDDYFDSSSRDCYILCKAFRLEPLTCSIQVNKTEGWMSETGLQKLCPLDARGNVISYEDDGSCDDYSEDDYDVDDDDGEIQAEEKRNAAKDDLRTENVHSNSFKADEGRDLDRSEHELAVRTLHDISCLTDTDDGIVKVLVGYDNAEDTYELTAEKCIPSYHLKSLFLQEAETILSASGTFSDIHLQTIPYKVYDRLKTAVDTQYLTTLFFPSQNIYRQPQDDDNLHASIKLRMSYIDTILRLLRELGFGFQC